MDDYLGEMLTLRPIDDTTAEALLTGGVVAADLEPLAAAIRAFRRVAERPVWPSPELAAQMAAGVFIGPAEQTEHFGEACEPKRGLGGEACEPKRRSDRGAPGTAAERGHHPRRGRTSARAAVAVLGAKIAGMSLVVKALAGLGMATAAAGTAGLAGALPDPAQDRFEAVVESVTPYHFPERSAGKADFGDEVSEDAKHDGVDGGDVSERARQQGEQRRPGEVPAPVLPTPGQPSELPTPDEGPPPGNPPIDPPGEERRPVTPPGR